MYSQTMNYNTLLYNAIKNKQGKSEPIQYYSTKFAPPKKEQKNMSGLSVNVKKFLERKEEEERQNRLEAQRRKEKLLALRSQDKKAVKRVKVMLKLTKSADQSVIQDARESENTAVTLVAPAQPVEDDYGYVSKEASAFHTKMVEKYSKMPEQPSKFTLEKKKVNPNLNSTKDRVKAALENGKEEAMMAHGRKRKLKDMDYGSSSPESHTVHGKSGEKKIKMDKPKHKVLPPINFNDLLELAAKKQFEPIVIEKKPKEEERPLTYKQRREMEREGEWRERKNGKVRSEPDTKVKREMGSTETKLKTQTKSESGQTNTSNRKDVNLQDPIEPAGRKKIDWGPKHPSFGRINASNDINKGSSDDVHSPPRNSSKSENPPKNSVYQVIRNNSSQKDLTKHNKDIGKNENKKLLTKPKEKQIMKEQIGSRQFNSRPKQFPPNDLRPKQFPPTDLRKKQISKLQMRKRRIIDDDDDEYDSELDDFIDDGPEEEEDYSKYIQEIFGYNKSKYRYVDDDDDYMMESSYAQQMKEESISAKFGKLEDLEDMKLEEQHNREKALRKKKMQKFL